MHSNSSLEVLQMTAALLQVTVVEREILSCDRIDQRHRWRHGKV